MSPATHGWRRRTAGAYDRGLYSVRRQPSPSAPDRPWVLLRSTVNPGAPEHLGRFHTLRLAQQAAQVHAGRRP